MMLKALITSALLTAASSAFAVSPAVRTVQVQLGEQDRALFRVSSTVCVGNLDLDKPVTAQYRYGADGEWKTETFAPHTIVEFTQRYPTDMQPAAFTVKFLAQDGTDAPEVSYDLLQTETRLTPRVCDFVENYRFQKTDAPTPTIDLVHVGQ